MADLTRKAQCVPVVGPPAKSAGFELFAGRYDWDRIASLKELGAIP